MKTKEKVSHIFSPMRIIALGFLILILIGGVLLYLPISNQQSISLMDSFFTATTSVCVTGLVTVEVLSQFTTLGQVIILALIQIGGLRLYCVYNTFLYCVGEKDFSFE